MPPPRRTTSVVDHPIVITFLIMAVVGAMAMASEVLKPLALAVLLSFALTPVSRSFERLGLNRAVSVVLTVVIGLGTLGGIGYVVYNQLSALALELPASEANIQKKIGMLLPKDDSAFKKASQVATDVAQQFETQPLQGEVQRVRVVEQPTYHQRLQNTVGPYIEFLGVGSFVLVLVLFMMLKREDLRDRIVSLFGRSRVSLTTRSMDEIGRRTSRYIATFAAVNSCFGLVIGLGLWAIGVPYAVLWGCLAAMLRFIPYVGPAVAFTLPMVYSFAHFTGFKEPLEVLALFAVIETLLNSALEPIIYGKTTGISALGLLVAAMFWTWLWGLLGLLLSTPLTVCLAVLGKYIPSLSVFATLLGDETELDPDVRFYQRLVALDRDGAVEIVDESLKARQRAEVFDAVLVPALARAEKDAAEGYLEDRDLAFVRRVVEEIVDDLEGASEITLESVAKAKDKDRDEASGVGVNAAAAVNTVIGVGEKDSSDVIVLKMLGMLLSRTSLKYEIVTDAPTPLALAERVEAAGASAVVLSHLPPSSKVEARYKVRRLRARFADLPVVVGRWGVRPEASASAAAAGKLEDSGASLVATSLIEARDFLAARFAPPAEDPEALAVGASVGAD